MDSTERVWESDSNFGTSFDCYLKHVLGKQLKLSSIVHDDQIAEIEGLVATQRSKYQRAAAGSKTLFMRSAKADVATS